MRRSQLDPDQNVKATDFSLVPPSVKIEHCQLEAFQSGISLDRLMETHRQRLKPAFVVPLMTCTLKHISRPRRAVMPFTLQQQPEWYHGWADIQTSEGELLHLSTSENPPEGRRGALINGWWNAGPLWWHAPLSRPPLYVSPTSVSLTHLPSAEQEARQDSRKKPACVYHPLNAHDVESSACHLNAL